MLYNKENCCGCGACAQVCAKGCIAMVEDKEGFLYPSVNSERCVHCGLCEKACPISKDKGLATEKSPSAYAAYSRDETIRLNSSSGGIFSELAKAILEQGGIVFGAALDEKLCAHEISVENIEQLSLLMGSKYMQNRTEQTFVQVLCELQKGRMVLYTGSPCEIEGLHTFLGKDYDNLYLQDIICHGSPSPLLWRKYLQWRQDQDRDKVQTVCFRDKSQGWKNYSMAIHFHHKTMKQLASKNKFMRLFLQDICLRPNCYQCQFKKKNRVSDFTLADFWGCDQVCPEMNDNKGLSLVIVHSEKGKSLLNQIQERLVIKPVDFNEAIKRNPSFTEPAVLPDNRAYFMDEILVSDFATAAKKFLKKTSMFARMKRLIPQKVKSKIKTSVYRANTH